MTIKKCTCGQAVTTKNAKKVATNVWVLGGKPYRMLWFSCGACLSTGVLKAPTKPSAPAFSTAS